MDALRIHREVDLRDPVLLIAFYGWNDAAESATDVIRFLRRAGLRAGGEKEAVAEIDAEEFFVFTEQRPTVRITEGMSRAIDWPVTDFTVARLPGAERDLVLGLGTEPHLKWRTFTRLVLELMDRLRIDEIFTLGALLADTPHTRPVPVSGGASNPERAIQLGFQPSRYEGPTGIVGALGDACRAAGREHLSLWASVPHYISGGKNPRATHALLSRLGDLYGLELDLGELDRRGARWQIQVSEALKDNPDVQSYVQNLEQARDEGGEPSSETPSGPPLSSEDVLNEVNRLLAGDEPERE